MESSPNWQTIVDEHAFAVDLCTYGAGKSLVKPNKSANKYLVLRWNAKQGATSAGERRKNALFTPFGKRRSHCTTGRIYDATFAIGTRQDSRRRSKNTRRLSKSLQSGVPPDLVVDTSRGIVGGGEESAVESSCTSTSSYRQDWKHYRTILPTDANTERRRLLLGS